MLVLTRRAHETVIINDHIKVHVLSINPRQVKLGFEAPPDVPIHRSEIYQRIQEEKREALEET